jgi:hypothetical protein
MFNAKKEKRPKDTEERLALQKGWLFHQTASYLSWPKFGLGKSTKSGKASMNVKTQP